MMSIYDVKRIQTVLISFTNNVNCLVYKQWTLLELAFLFDNLDVDNIYVYTELIKIIVTFSPDVLLWIQFRYSHY